MTSIRDEYVAKRSRQLAHQRLARDGLSPTAGMVERVAPRYRSEAQREFDNRNKVDRYAYGVPRTSGNVGAISAQRKPANRTSSLARMLPDPEDRNV